MSVLKDLEMFSVPEATLKEAGTNSFYTVSVDSSSHIAEMRDLMLLMVL
jgi:hypothetical protein